MPMEEAAINRLPHGVQYGGRGAAEQQGQLEAELQQARDPGASQSHRSFLVQREGRLAVQPKHQLGSVASRTEAI